MGAVNCCSSESPKAHINTFDKLAQTDTKQAIKKQKKHASNYISDSDEEKISPSPTI